MSCVSSLAPTSTVIECEYAYPRILACAHPRNPLPYPVLSHLAVDLLIKRQLVLPRSFAGLYTGAMYTRTGGIDDLLKSIFLFHQTPVFLRNAPLTVLLPSMQHIKPTVELEEPPRCLSPSPSWGFLSCLHVPWSVVRVSLINLENLKLNFVLSFGIGMTEACHHSF